MSGNPALDAAHASADARRAAGWQLELQSGSQALDGAREAGNFAFGNAVFAVADAIATQAQAHMEYVRANDEILNAARDHVAANNEANPRSTGDWCVVS